MKIQAGVICYSAYTCTLLDPRPQSFRSTASQVGPENLRVCQVPRDGWHCRSRDHALRTSASCSSIFVASEICEKLLKALKRRKGVTRDETHPGERQKQERGERGDGSWDEMEKSQGVSVQPVVRERKETALEGRGGEFSRIKAEGDGVSGRLA